MDPRLFLSLAEELLSRLKNSQGLVPGDSSAECRTITSRAYYSAFLSAVQFLDRFGLKVTEKGECHTVVREGLLCSKEAQLVQVGSRLGTLATDRTKADYRLNDPQPGKFQQAEFSVNVAKEAVGLLNAWWQAHSNDTAKIQEVANRLLDWAKNCGKANLLRRS